MINAPASYQVILLGDAQPYCLDICQLAQAALHELGLPTSSFSFLTIKDAGFRNPALPTIAIYFGAENYSTDTQLVFDLIDESIVIATVVTDLAHINTQIPPQLRGVNAIENKHGANLPRLVTLVFETFRLLRRERRLFISYRRMDSQPLAEKLYDALDKRGFDVFIDVRSVPPSADFQSQLWHRMSDSDVVVLIDTPGFRESRWTTEELARANATNIQILHLLWPGQREDAKSSFSYFFNLRRRDFWSFVPMRGVWAKERLIGRICQEVELLRAKALGARHRYLVDNFCDAARDEGLHPSVQVGGWISIELGSKGQLAVVPAIGVPTADKINEIFEAVEDPAYTARQIWVVYDNRGILESWLSHLAWLDVHLPVKTVQMAKAPRRLAELIS